MYNNIYNLENKKTSPNGKVFPTQITITILYK